MTTVSDISTILSGLSGAQLLNLGGQLTSSNEAKAIGVLEAMRANPSTASAFIATLSTIPNLPPQVMSYVSQAIAALPGNTAQFGQFISDAEAVLTATLSSESSLQQAGL